MSFNKKLLLFLLLLLSVQGILWWLVVEPRMVSLLREEVAERARVQSRQIAELDQLIARVRQQDIAGVRRLVDELYQVSDADFIVVSDRQGRRMAHPKPERIGLPVMGGDIEAALTQGRHYLSEGTGSLGRSLRYISPLIDDQGDIVGMVKVGYLIDTLGEWRRIHLMPITLMAASSIILAFIAAFIFSRWIRRGMLGREPQQLLQLLEVHQAILHSTHEGLIAVDGTGRIGAINQTACTWLDLDPAVVQGQPVDAWIESQGFCDPKAADVVDDMASLNHLAVIASRVALNLPDGGVVISFRRRDEISMLSQQLSQISQHTESLRIMRHEYANKLSTLGGLIQMGALDKALQLINQQSERHQQVIDLVKQSCCAEQLAGLLIGKYHRAAERQLRLELVPGSSLRVVPAGLDEAELCAIVGNLIDNSFDACRPGDGVIQVFFSDEGPEFELRVSDNGCGIPAALKADIFEWGVSSKTEPGHGIGLYLVDRYVRQAGGYLELDNEQEQTCISVYVPKEGTEHDRCVDCGR
ncbi:sensor histidine kinase [Photobacterium sp. MCCC 1A19761]|uniref:sensor histidine kinase n=1 Tax=Photobacterium sp. MCCC 1A19761 TaxID=3115000 RepID=UPI00307F695E